MIAVRRLEPGDAAAWKALRLAALRECPAAFSASLDDECTTPLASIAARMAPDSGRNYFGAFDGDQLVGVVAMAREDAAKLRHKAFIRAMYVDPAARGQGAGRQLMAQALACAQGMDGLRSVTLDVTAGQEAALGLYQSLGFQVYGREPGALLVDGRLYDTLLMVLHVQTD